MKMIPFAKKRHFFAAIYACWMLTLVFLILTGLYRNYLHPAFLYSLWFGAGSLVVFAAVELTDVDGIPLNSRFLSRGAILILPLVALWTSYGSPLDFSALMTREVIAPSSPRLNRMVSRNSGTTKMSALVSAKRNTQKAVQAKTLLDNGGSTDGKRGSSRNVVVSRPSFSVTMLDLLLQPKDYDGKRVITEGMAISRATVNKRVRNAKEALPENTFSLFRFYIVCCISDCKPMVVLVNSPEEAKIQDNKWYRISGRFESDKNDRGIAGVIEEATFEIMPTAPADPYLYDRRPKSFFSAQHSSATKTSP